MSIAPSSYNLITVCKKTPPRHSVSGARLYPAYFRFNIFFLYFLMTFFFAVTFLESLEIRMPY